MKITASLCIIASLLFTVSEAALTGTWPTVDKPPPPVASWTALVDQTKVAKAPLVAAADVGIKCPTTDTYCNWSCTGCTRPESDVVKCPTQGDWGITFDDGPTEFTPALLDFLLKQNIKVTFFVIGSRVIENPQTLQREVKDGHQIGVHTWSHTALTTQTNEEIIAEIKWTEMAIKQATGLTPKYMRPPYGDVDDRVRAILQQLGYMIVIWDKDTNDWISGDDKTFDISWVEGNFTEWVKENDPTGHISLEHDLYNQTAAQGPKVVPIVEGAGFTIKPVYQCVGDQNAYLESTTQTDTTTTTDNTGTTTPASAADTTTDSAATSPGGTQYLQSPSPSADATSPTTTKTSNAISHINNSFNNLLLLFVLSILGYFMGI
uniref:chitin deacetylase n=1 Tax=Anthurium amnicola TaxID=1678845 RepID=A0A1D1Y1F3_9ARAE